jgi:hypothetical protein
VSEDRTDLITAALAVSYGALALVIDAVIATGALVAQLLDVIAGHTGPRGPRATAVRGGIPSAGATALTTGLPLAFHNVHQLRQLARHTGLPRWWSANRSQCLAALAGGAA